MSVTQVRHRPRRVRVRRIYMHFGTGSTWQITCDCCDGHAVGHRAAWSSAVEVARQHAARHRGGRLTFALSS